MSDPIDAILGDTILLLIVIIILLVVVGGIFNIFFFRVVDDRYKSGYRRRKSSYKKIPRRNKRYTFVGQKGMFNVYMDSETGKPVYENRKTLRKTSTPPV